LASDPTSGTPLILAHRGGNGPWRENTLAAFTGAIASGADGVELDVRLTVDGVPVVHHDPVVASSTPIAGTEAVSLPDWVPTLVDALACCNGYVVNVELKVDRGEDAPAQCDRLAEAVVPLLRDRARVVVSSFWPAALQAVADTGAEVATGLLVHPGLDPAGFLDTAVALGCRALHPHFSWVSSALVDRAHQGGLVVTAWTVNTEPEVIAALASGVDGLITDDVAGVLAACGRSRP